jgi:hypothetical protein
MSGYDLQINGSNIKKIINDLTEAMLKLDVTEKNIDDFFKLEAILKSNEDELRIKKQLISYKLRKYYHEKYLEQYKKILQDTTPNPLIYQKTTACAQ